MLAFESRSRGRNNWKGAVLTGLCCLALLLTFYGDLILRSGSVLFSMESDGIKNYYTFLYHVRHDPSYLHFQGLNYPFGEHILYTGARPLVVIGTQWASKLVGGGTGFALAVANLSLLLTIIPAGVFLFLILRELNLPRTYSLLTATGLTFLSPQILRFGGHPNLGYTAVIPACWYLFIRFFKEPRWKWTGLLALNSVFWAAVDPYYLFLCSALLAGLWLFALLPARSSRRPDRRALLLHALVQIGLPVFVIALALGSTDTQLHARPAITDSAFYRSSLAAIFLPSYPTFGIDCRWFVHWFHPEAEGIAYVGLVGLASLPLLVARGVILVRRRRLALGWSPGAVLSVSLAASLLVLLYAFGFPFRLGLDSWFRYLGPLQQFRTVGRLGWIFFYVYTVSAFYIVYVLARFLRFRGFRRLGWCLLAGSLLILYMEAGVQNRTLSRIIDLGPDRLAALRPDSPQLEWTRHVDPKRYQAIIPLPYFHIGSDLQYTRFGSELSVLNSLLASLQTALPLTADFLSRTPVAQARLSTGLLEGNPEILEHFPNQKPLLILATHEELRPGEQQVLRNARKLFENSSLIVAEISFEELRRACSSACPTP